MSCCNESTSEEKKKSLGFGLKGNWEFLHGVLASKDVVDQRISICNSCENYKLGFCSFCGCVVELKVRLVAVQCPIEKWSIPDEYRNKGEGDVRKS